MENLHPNHDSEEERAGKKLRSSDPDLKIVVGGAPNTREYWYYSPTMASQSYFIDTMLASPMNESISREIKLPDLAPEDWDRMMKFLELSNCQKMTLQEAVELVPLYNKYEFREALALCEGLIADSFNKKSLSPKEVSKEDIYLLIQLFEAIDEGGLSSATVESALNLIALFVKQPLRCCGRLLLSGVQLEHLVPLLRRAERSIISTNESFFSGWTEEDINNPMFPRLFVKQWELWNASTLLKEATSSVWVYGLLPDTKCFEGQYDKEGERDEGLVFKASAFMSVPPDIEGFKFDGTVIKKRRNEFESAEFNGCWTICLVGVDDDYDEMDYPMWIVPESQATTLPPKDGWIPAKNERVGRPHLSFPGTSPKIRYCEEESE